MFVAQPTAQYGQMLCVTVAPAMRGCLLSVLSLQGCGGGFSGGLSLPEDQGSVYKAGRLSVAGEQGKLEHGGRSFGLRSFLLPAAKRRLRRFFDRRGASAREIRRSFY